ncbi:MAG: hypothetical protein HY283_08160 [Nitrospirae bacterium]|nr:hypothetical protein [Nitrospirota bacterium]
MHRLIVIIAVLIFPSLAAAGAVLPNGYEQAGWGISVAELKKQVEVDRVEMTDEFGYAEHLEEDPEVYSRITPKHERIEYYFYQGRLYKVFVIYDRIFFHTRFYEGLIEEMTKSFGPPPKTYQEEFFGLSIQHARWEDAASVLDLRKGAGFIYQVRIDKAADQKKTKSQTKKKSI